MNESCQSFGGLNEPHRALTLRSPGEGSRFRSLVLPSLLRSLPSTLWNSHVLEIRRRTRNRRGEGVRPSRGCARWLRPGNSPSALRWTTGPRSCGPYTRRTVPRLEEETKYGHLPPQGWTLSSSRQATSVRGRAANPTPPLVCGIEPKAAEQHDKQTEKQKLRGADNRVVVPGGGGKRGEEGQGGKRLVTEET